jgi:hypothetical protein
MDVCVRLFGVCAILCVGSGLATGWSLVQRVLPPVKKRLWNWRRGQDPTKDCGAIDDDDDDDGGGGGGGGGVGGGCIDLHILDLCISWKLVVKFTPWPLYPRVPIGYESGWAPTPVWTTWRGKIVSLSELKLWPLGSPDRSQSLYRLRNPGLCRI